MKTIVITGATSGIGELITKEFAKLDYKIFAGYRNEDLKPELQQISTDVIPFYIDLSKKETIVAAAEFICDQTDKIDTLVNAAGGVIAGAMECLPLDKIREQFEINTFSHLELTQGLYSKLNGGKIINISSTSSFGVYPFIAPYCASKRALDMLFNSLSIECCLDVTVVSIKPGVIKTPLWDKAIEENVESLGGNKKYEKEFAFMVKNAKKCSETGLDPKIVANLVLKVDMMDNPKPSYTVGLDAKMAEVLSHLPQSWINFIVKKTLAKRCNF
jgi:short-subunit dehydrogenase